MPTREQVETTVREYIDAVGRQDLEATVALFAEDAHQEDPVGTPANVGRDAIRGFFERGYQVPFSTTLTGVLNTSSNTLTVDIPPTGTAITHFETTITKKKSGKNTYYVMARCKKKKWTNSETTTFSDGSSTTASSTQKCKQKPSKK